MRQMRREDWRRFSELLALIRSGRGIGPTFKEIAKAWGVGSNNTVFRGLRRLEDAGLIRRLPSRRRMIEVTKFLVPHRSPDGDVLLPAARC